MRKFLSLMTAALIAVTLQASAVIIETHDLSRLELELKSVGEKSLVMFDVDDTLIFPNDLIFRKCNWEMNEKLVNEIIKNPDIVPSNKYPKLHLHSTVLSTTNFVLVDPKIVPIIHSLQSRNIPTIAFTKMGSWTLGVIPSLTEFRFAQLKKHNLDFSKAFSSDEFPKFQHVKKNEKSFCFSGGVLYSNEFDKGPILEMFLEALNWKPNKIVFLDDREDYLQTVEDALKGTGIEFIGLYYTAAKKISAPADEKLSEFQYRHLAEHGIWLTDEQALELMPAPASL